MRRLSIAVLTALLFVLAGCGDDGGDAAPAGDSSPSPAAGGDEATGACPSEPFTGTVEKAESSDGDVNASLRDADVVLAQAYGLDLGSNYTVYLADYDLGDQSVGLSTVTADEGQVVVTINAKSDDGVADIEVGTVYDANFVIIDSGGGAQGVSEEPTGTITFIDVSDARICFEIDWMDEPQGERVQGTVSAEVVGGF